MPNQYFQFKTFTIQQQYAAMKVTTEACLFGAWASQYLQQKQLPIQQLLDIGSGTGLLSLLVAQHHNFFIETIEINAAAYQQTIENICLNNKTHQIKAFHTSLQQFATTNKQLFNCIISNPPFYENQLKAASLSKNMALHNDGLTFTQLLASTATLLQQQGICILLFPFYRLQEMQEIAANNNLFANHLCYVQQTNKHSYFRVMAVFSFQKSTITEEYISIKNNHNNYSYEFTQLLQPYYLHL